MVGSIIDARGRNVRVSHSTVRNGGLGNCYCIQWLLKCPSGESFVLGCGIADFFRSLVEEGRLNLLQFSIRWWLGCGFRWLTPFGKSLSSFHLCLMMSKEILVTFLLQKFYNQSKIMKVSRWFTLSLIPRKVFFSPRQHLVLHLSLISPCQPAVRNAYAFSLIENKLMHNMCTFFCKYIWNWGSDKTNWKK